MLRRCVTARRKNKVFFYFRPCDSVDVDTRGSEPVHVVIMLPQRYQMRHEFLTEMAHLASECTNVGL